MSNANVSSKACFKCGISKPRSEFYKHDQMADGLLGKCKECTKIDASEYRIKNIDRIRKYDKTRAKLPHRIVLGLRLQAERRKADKRKNASYCAVARALRSGIIKWQPCCVCKSDKSLAHHESYDRPLEVVWYCQIHHKERHKQMAMQGINP